MTGMAASTVSRVRGIWLLPPSIVLAGVGAALLLAVGAEGSPAVVQSVSCGDTITQSVKLTADLHCSTSDGLDVGANHVTVDLGGHTIFGTSPYNGVADNGYPYATIKNGSIDGFTNAVYLHTAAHTSVAGIVARNNPGVAIAVDASPFTAVSKATVVAYGYEGVYLQTDGSSLTSSTVSASSNPVGIGIVVWGSGDTVSGNAFLASAKDGIHVQYGGGNQVTKNRVEGAGDNGIRLYDTQGATVSGNTVTGSAGVGILVQTTSDGTLLTKNTVWASGADGIEIGTDSLGSLITANTSNGNRSSGIDVQNTDPSSRLGKNTADFNALDGIIGAVGDTDLGGNSGTDNGHTDCNIGGFPCS
jgi:parallel beta-helix repeat protein